MVTDEHIAFARAVAALAREHRMDDVRMTFRKCISARLHEGGGPDQWERVTANWHTGRHGAEGRIEMQTEARMELPERAAAPAA
jgi:hypothetical protein